MKPSQSLLGDDLPVRKVFPDLEELLAPFRHKEFASLTELQRGERVGRRLMERIQKEKGPCFLLAPVLDFLEKVERQGVLPRYTLSHFELWLNHFSGLSFEDNRQIRGKIAGKWISRDEYQSLFPIGMGKIYSGTHFVTAHRSPDLDTMVASFWGWLDAFAARVGDGLHLWNLPGGPPPAQIEVQWLFSDVFGSSLFTHSARDRTHLTLTGQDLMTQQGVRRKTLTQSITEPDHEHEERATLLVDEAGYYLSDWLSSDVEGAHQVVLLLSSALRWFESRFEQRMIALFARETIRHSELVRSFHDLFATPLLEAEPIGSFSLRQKREVVSFLTEALGLTEGLSVSFETLGQKLFSLADLPPEGFVLILKTLATLFDRQGHLVAERPTLFSLLEKGIATLNDLVFRIRRRLEKLDIALKTKTDVFGLSRGYATPRSDVEEIRSKMGSSPFLAVVIPEKDKLLAMGVIPASKFRQKSLGTVSLRDFCNRDEVAIPPYLDIISVIDHHRSELSTPSPPLAIIGDVQSSNSLVADKAFQINDRHSLRGQEAASVDRQLRALSQHPSGRSLRLLRRLLRKQEILGRSSHAFVDPEREFLEYLHFLFAIFDDTDLLTKVSPFDVECVVSLVNRLKSLAEQEEVELLSLDDLPRGESFAKEAARRILQHEEVYSLYKKAYHFREQEMAKTVLLAAAHKPSSFFADTKEQNGCCRVGQTKLFASNISSFLNEGDAIRALWIEGAQSLHAQQGEIDLHLHMVSTIMGAEEVHRGTSPHYPHQDELWIWIPGTDSSIEHLKRFLSALQGSPGLQGSSMEVEFLGANASELERLFVESFRLTPRKKRGRDLPMAILRYTAGVMNSRKAMVTPFLPT